jgi:hypothetical protein
MKDSNVFFLGTQAGVRVYNGHDDQWHEGPSSFRGRQLPGSKRHPEIVYCCVLHDGVYRSLDTGMSWERIFEGNARAAAVDRSDDHVVYVGTEPVRLYRSEDRGNTWDELKNLLDLPDRIIRKSSTFRPNMETSFEALMAAKPGEDVSRGIDYLDIHKISNQPIRQDLYFMTSARGFSRSTDPARGWTRVKIMASRGTTFMISCFYQVNRRS